MHRRIVVPVAAAVTFVGGVGAVLAIGLGDDRPDVRSENSSPGEESPAENPVAYGLAADDLPEGYEVPAGIGALASAEGEGAVPLDGGVTADVYQVGARKVALLAGPSEALESFVPASPSETQQLADGRVADVFVDLSSPDRVAVAIRASEDGAWERVVIADGAPGDTQSLVALAAAPFWTVPALRSFR